MQAHARLSELESPPMLPADNMVDLVRKARVGFMNQKAFATMIGSPGYFDTDFITDVTRHER
jgi:hypothetical protein